MKTKGTYKSIDVERLDVLALVKLMTVGCIVAIDVAKTKFVAALANAAGEVMQLVRFEHPRQTLVFLRLLEALREAKLEPRVVMEPTGTYGDALRAQCHQRGIPVHMMSPKHTHDFAEIVDGVPSMHDPKAAVALARLATFKVANPWKPPSEERRNARALLDQRWPLSKTLALYHGHLESMLARHWPEFDSRIDVHQQRSWMKLLSEFPGPQPVAARREHAAETLRTASRGRFTDEHIDSLVDSAGSTLGVPMLDAERGKLRFIVEQIEQQRSGLDVVDKQLAELVDKHDTMKRLACVVGPVCAAAIVSEVGSPLDFDSAAKLEKAIGLNLKEKSSGEKKGRLSITKRGSAHVRQLLYFAALRLLHEPIVGSWYRARRSFTHGSGGKLKAVVAVMRKLARALWHVARGATFDPTKLFDVRRLALASPTATSADRSAPSRRAPRQGGVAQPA
jgi:transposase